MNRRLVMAALTVALGLGFGGTLESGAAASLPVDSQALTPYRTCTLTGTPSSTTYVLDTGARQGSPTANNGTATTIVVASTSSANQRVYISFDLARCSPVIPATATVRLATLRLFATALPAVCRTIDIFRVTAAWTETVVTWNNQPFGTTLNNPASAARTDSFNAGTASGCENLTASAYTVGAIVTADVAAFVSGAAVNRGWMLRDDVEGSSTARTTTFASIEANVVNRAPQLVISWVAGS